LRCRRRSTASFFALAASSSALRFRSCSSNHLTA
jgi:hypothetical protein